MLAAWRKKITLHGFYSVVFLGCFFYQIKKTLASGGLNIKNLNLENDSHWWFKQQDKENTRIC